MEEKFLIQDISCSNCKAKIEKNLKKVRGVKFEIDLKDKTLKATSKKSIDTQKIVEAVSGAGYTAKILQGEE